MGPTIEGAAVVYTGVGATAKEEEGWRAPIRKWFSPAKAQPGPHERIHDTALAHGLPAIPGFYGYDFDRHEFTRTKFQDDHIGRK